MTLQIDILPSGGSGIVILREGSAQPGIASISKTSGDPIPAKNNPAKLYPKKAFREAIELTAGLPYTKRSAPSAPVPAAKVPEGAAEPVLEAVIDSNEYQKIVDTYTDKSGKLSYGLLNKALIRFAHASSKVRGMIAQEDAVETIRLYIVGTKFRNITGNRNLSDELRRQLKK